MKSFNTAVLVVLLSSQAFAGVLIRNSNDTSGSGGPKPKSRVISETGVDLSTQKAVAEILKSTAVRGGSLAPTDVFIRYRTMDRADIVFDQVDLQAQQLEQLRLRREELDDATLGSLKESAQHKDWVRRIQLPVRGLSSGLGRP